MYNKLRMSAPNQFNNLLEGFLNNDFALTAECKPSNLASVNIRENADQFEMQVIAPGLQKEDFKIDIEQSKLTVSFEQKQETKESDDKWIRQEFKIQSFKRSFTLSNKIDTTGINATYENGILRVSLPKKEKEEPKVMSISVQ